MKFQTFELCITLVILLYAFIEGYVDRRRRWKRQTLPSDNVQVHSFDSNVTIQDQVVVTSSNSRIELFESHFDATIWSSSSLLRFNPND
uniref:Uncharacterized protein n=1 Tax=Panagrolaimus sp. PS1159 TaxID=55785 RepID=A0AC35GEE4_9BILA